MKAMRDVWGDTLVSLGSTNPNLLVLDADLANSTKADKFAKMYPDRFLQMGIAEQNFVGAAVGLASVGFIPWLSTFTVFFTHRAADPIRMLGCSNSREYKDRGSILRSSYRSYREDASGRARSRDHARYARHGCAGTYR